MARNMSNKCVRPNNGMIPMCTSERSKFHYQQTQSVTSFPCLVIALPHLTMSLEDLFQRLDSSRDARGPTRI